MVGVVPVGHAGSGPPTEKYDRKLFFRVSPIGDIGVRGTRVSQRTSYTALPWAVASRSSRNCFALIDPVWVSSLKQNRPRGVTIRTAKRVSQGKLTPSPGGREAAGRQQGLGLLGTMLSFPFVQSLWPWPATHYRQLGPLVRDVAVLAPQGRPRLVH